MMGPIGSFYSCMGLMIRGHTGFCRLTVVNGTPGFWSVTVSKEIPDFYFIGTLSYLTYKFL